MTAKDFTVQSFMLFPTTPFTDFFLFASTLINSDIFFALSIAAIWLFLSFRKPTSNRAALAALALLLAFSASMVAKDYYRVERPCVYGAESLIPCPYWEYSFPSVHTTVAFALALAYLGAAEFLPLLAFAVFVAFTRLFLGVHTPYDVAGGITLAVLSVGVARGLALRTGSMFTPKKGAHSYATAASENLRQFLHLCIGTLAILLFAFFGREFAQYVFVSGLVASVILLGLLLRGANLGFLTKVFKMLSRARGTGFHEYDLGLVWLLAGISLVLLTLSGPAAVVSLVAVGIGDSLSTFFGKHGTNKLPYNHKKTWRGWLSMFACCLPSVVFFGWIGVLWSVLAAFVESLPLHIDDNLTIALFCILFFTLL
ncbi:MAG: phosphatase PAP2 family protein [Candidatus Micrarchaeia archaeon]